MASPEKRRKDQRRRHPNNLVLPEKWTTLGMQSKLPRLPLPDVNTSLAMFERHSKTLLDPEKFKALKAKLDAFRGGEVVAPGSEADQIYKVLEKRKEDCDKRGDEDYPHVHWLEEWWENMAYLSDRRPCAINVNIMGTMNECRAFPDRFDFAASLVESLRSISEEWNAGTLRPDTLGNKGTLVMCMHQYRHLFSTSRTPGLDMDKLQTRKGCKHIIVTAYDQMYRMELYAPDGRAYTRHELRYMMQQTEADAAASRSKPEAPVATLTGWTRADWARRRIEMLKDAQNARSLDDVESALFHVVFSNEEPETPDDIHRHNNGNGSNVWYDQSMTLILFKNGRGGCHFEHSASDATVTSRAVIRAGKHAQEMAGTPLPKDAPKMAASLALPKKVKWTVTPGLVRDIASAAVVIGRLLEDHVFLTTLFEDFGSRALRELRITPDSFVQITLQLAHWRDQGRLVPTYESAATRLFLHGRTDTIRATDPATLSFVRMMDDDTASMADKKAALGGAFLAHKKFLSMAMQGQAFDRLLLGMRMVAAGATGPVVKPTGTAASLFMDPAFQYMCHFTLSTSQIVFDTADYPGFGAPAPDAYGVCYICALPDKIVFDVSCRNSAPGKDGRRFQKHIVQAARDLFALATYERARL